MVKDSLENYDEKQAAWVTGQQIEDSTSGILMLVKEKWQYERLLLEEAIELDIKLKLVLLQERQDKIRAQRVAAKNREKSAGEMAEKSTTNEIVNKIWCRGS